MFPFFKNVYQFSLTVVCYHDQDGKIHITVKRSFIYKFRGMLNEEKVYIISQFEVGQNSGSYRTIRYAFMINFQYSTLVNQCENMASMSKIWFIFTHFDEILHNMTDDNYLVDKWL